MDESSSNKSSKESLFRLRWDNQASLLGSLATLFHEEAFVDTTIFTDGKLFRAHRLLLSASSPYLKHILQSVPGEHSVLLLPHIPSKDFEHVLKFIYEGEIKISQADLRPFLHVSKLLRIKGMEFEEEEESQLLDSLSLSPPEHSGKNETNTKKRSREVEEEFKSLEEEFRMRRDEEEEGVRRRGLKENYEEEEEGGVSKGIKGRGRRRREELCEEGVEEGIEEEEEGNNNNNEVSEIVRSKFNDDEEDEEVDKYDDEIGCGLLPEVSMEVEDHFNSKNSSEWIPHSSTHSHLSKKQKYGDGILMRMMKEPLKSSLISTTTSNNSASNSPLFSYDLDEPGMKRSKRYVQCGSCSKVLSSLSALKRHMEDVHCARIQGKCLICGRVYSSRNSLLTHVYSAHKKHTDYKAVARIIRESDFETFNNN